MENFAKTLSSNIINTHMQNLNIKNKKDLLLKLKINEFKFELYDSKKLALLSKLKEKIDFSKDFYIKDKNLYLIDKSTYLHLGVKYIVIKEDNFFQKINNLSENIIIAFLLSLLFISIIGYFLSKLFLEPIKNEINNLDRFIRDTTHELNTPISALLMSINSIKNSNVETKKLKRIEISAKQISDLYSDLTYMLFSDKLQKDIQKINFEELINERVNYFFDLANVKNIEFILNLSEFYFEIDESDAIRLIDNLISNAIKYNKIGGKIEINLNKNILVFKDNGIGIKEEKLKEIFDRYKRVNPEKGGFGIGLNIVFNIAKEYNIKIGVSSKLKEGSEFKFYF